MREEVSRERGTGPASIEFLDDLHRPRPRREVRVRRIAGAHVRRRQCVPGHAGLDVNVSGRYDDYSDFGDTTNPKYAMNWTIVDGVRIRANYAESFTAPALTSRGNADGVTAESSFGGLLGATASGVNANFAIPNTYPGAIGLPGCTAATPTCLINTSSVPGVFLAGGNKDLVAQEGETYSVGIDIEPRPAAGLALQRDVVEHEIPRRDHGAASGVRDRLTGSQQPAAVVPGRRARRMSSQPLRAACRRLRRWRRLRTSSTASSSATRSTSKRPASTATSRTASRPTSATSRWAWRCRTS